MIPSYEDVKKARESLKDLAFEHWIQDDLFTWKWWLLVAATIIPWILWLIFHDKKRTFEILSCGLKNVTIAVKFMCSNNTYD